MGLGSTGVGVVDDPGVGGTGSPEEDGGAGGGHVVEECIPVAVGVEVDAESGARQGECGTGTGETCSDDGDAAGSVGT